MSHLLDQYKLVGGGKRHNIEGWLLGFIASAKLRYYCSDCLGKVPATASEKNNSTVPQDHDKLAVSVAVGTAFINNSIAALNAKLQNLHEAIIKLTPCNNATTTTAADDKTLPSKSKSYAQATAVSADIVKIAVSEAIR